MVGASGCVLLAALSVIGQPEIPPPPPDTTELTLSGLDICIDNQTGAVRRLAYPGVGVLLEADADEAGLVDAAYPMEGFEALRLAARHSGGARIESADDRVTIHIDRLGPSRPQFPSQGDVSATIEMRADADGRSIVLTCELVNGSDRPLRQVIFPELRGLAPVAGPDQTILKTCGFGSAPFRELVVPEIDQWYAESSSTVEHKAGGMFSTMWGRWADLGGLNGGLSVFPRRWRWDPQVPVFVQLRQATQRLRLLWAHPVEVKPGETWTSGEWVLTPHANGWAKGIEPYRAFVRDHAKRAFPVPRHIREALGFRSVWMCQNQPADPTDAVWHFSDLPDLAREARVHGLTEMVLWGAMPGFDAALPGVFAHLGTEQEFIAAASECRELGVRAVPFVSVLQASPKTAGRYGLTVPDNNGWTYHTEMLPRWNPPYATGYSCVQVGPSNQQWQDEVVASLRAWADKGFASVSWDQYWTGQSAPTMQDLTRRIREYALTLDPEASFSGEELWNIEVDCDYLDYTWNWGTYRDCQAYTNAFPAPRRNVNINRSEAEAKFAFMDNLFLNVWPTKPDGINGSERIGNVPVLSRTLQECAALRERFLPYFTDGVLIGSCLLPEVAPGARVVAYQLPDRVLALVLNQGAEGALTFRYDLAPWVPGRDAFTLSHFDQSGEPLDSSDVGAAATIQTQPLAPLQITAYEFVAG